MSDGTAYLLLLALWVAASAVTGGLLGLLAKRVHPGLSFSRLWLFYSVLMAFLVALVLVLGLF